MELCVQSILYLDNRPARINLVICSCKKPKYLLNQKP